MTKILTIGVYGYTEEEYFDALAAHGIDTFCDLRQRRGVRGAKYAFSNSVRLQSKLADLGIHYVHIKELAPSIEIRQLQKSADTSSKSLKRERSGLSDEFIETYKTDILEKYDPKSFLGVIGEDCQAAVLFCVERNPEACHRHLAADYLGQKLGISVEHIIK